MSYNVSMDALQCNNIDIRSYATIKVSNTLREELKIDALNDALQNLE